MQWGSGGEKRCQEFLSKYEKRLDDIEERVNTKANKANVDSPGTSVQVLNDQVKHLARDISRLNQKIESVKFEPVEKAKCKNNIVIRGVPENEELTDIEEIKRDPGQVSLWQHKSQRDHKT